MREFREILVPIDFSDACFDAIDPAYSLTRLIGGKVFLFHVLDLLPKPNPLYAHYAPRESMLKGELDRMELEARTKLHSLIPEGEEYKNVETEVVVLRHSSAFECIIEYGEEIGADVIVMTAKGWNTFAHILVGSTTENVIRHSKCPVLVIRAKDD